jgi:SAM-dependent methyltransferase
MTLNYYGTPELAAHYDADSAGRSDFAFYLALADRLRARRVADIGCGTGLLCSDLVHPGRSVIGVDPQPTMLALAKAQPNASAVQLIQGTAADLPSGWADLVLMTGHVAQYFLDDRAWCQVLTDAHRALQPDGHLAFEVRNDAVEAWRTWSTEAPVPRSGGTIRTEVRREGDLVTHTSQWDLDGRTFTTTETLRFPSWPAMTAGLAASGFTIAESWGDFDGRPIRLDTPEWIVLARKSE